MASRRTGDRLRLQLAGISESARSRLQYNTKHTPPVILTLAEWFSTTHRPMRMRYVLKSTWV